MILTISSSFATTTYTYTGNNFNSIGQAPFLPAYYNTGMSISGVLTLNAPLAASTTAVVTPVAFSFTDGFQIIDNTLAQNSNAQFTLRTDAAGNIDAWYISLFDPTFTTSVVVNPVCCTLTGHGIVTTHILIAQTIDQGSLVDVTNAGNINGSRGFIQNSPGVWTTELPEPSTFGLMAFGTALSALLARRRQK